MVTVAAIATLAGGGSAAANWSNERVAGGPSAIATETAIAPFMELPNGCGESWSSEDSID